MNKFRRLAFVIIAVEISLIIVCNCIYFMGNNSGASKLHRVEASRVVRYLENNSSSPDSIINTDLSKYKTIVGICEFTADDICNYDYVVEEINGKLYRIEYIEDGFDSSIIHFNLTLFIMMFVTLVLIFYVYRKVLKPFNSMSNLSYELAKGNLSIPIKEEKSKLFGRFLWGMDMLREKLEDNKEKELEFQKDRKTLILSLSHDIKTPLSSIELYSKALSENLYDTQDKKDEVLEGITKNVKEIKKYVNEIVAASREDFLNLEVNEGEVYLSDIISEIKAYYGDKLGVIHTDLCVDSIPNCLVKGDKNRLIEVLQNIMENAIKYGDGKSIHIYGEDEEDCKLIHIENTGNSLKEEELQNVFDSFYRGANSHDIKGSGLGLYICKNLMRKMDGDVYGRIIQDNFRVSVVIRKA